MLAISPGLHPYWAVFEPEDGCLAVQHHQDSFSASPAGKQDTEIILHGSMTSLALKVSSAEQSC